MTSLQSLLSEERPGTLCFGGARMALVDIGAGFWGLRRHMEALVGQRLTDGVLQQAGANGGDSFARAFTRDLPTADGVQSLRDCLAAFQAAGFGQFRLEALEWPIGHALVLGTDTFEAWMMQQHGQTRETPVCAYTAGVLVGFVNALGGAGNVVCVERECQAQGADACRFELLPAGQAGHAAAVGVDPDPFLGHQLNLLEILFDRMPMGIVILDRDLRVRRFNPTWAGYVDRYSPSSASQVVPGAKWLDLLPGTETSALPLFARALAGETVRMDAWRGETGGFVSYWDLVFTPLLEDGHVVGLIDVTTDATLRTLAQQELREREEQYRAIFESTTDALLIYDLDGTIVEANPAACRMHGYPHDELIGLSGTDVLHPDHHPLFEEFKRQVKAGGRYHARTVDLRKDGRPIHTEVSGTFFSYTGKPHLLAVLRDVTEQVLAYQTLEQEVAKRTRELQTLLAVTETASTSLALDEMLTATLDRLVVLVGASRAAVLLQDGATGRLAIRMIRPPGPTDPGELAVLTRVSPEVVAEGDSVSVQDGRPFVLLPLRAHGQVLGVLGIVGAEGLTFSPAEIALFEAMADQLGVSVENARLYEQREQAATLEERQRLARELHDSVTQSLYSLTLFAEAGRELAGSGHLEGVQHQLVRIGETALQALKEMRLLVHELRPLALERDGLVGALRQRLDAVEGRAGVRARLVADSLIELPPAVEEGLYRIAQEALNNALKHASATAVTVRLGAQAGRVELEVADNGCGFDARAGQGQGGLGLIGMRERAEKLRGVLTVVSTPGEGTRVKIEVSP